MAKHHPNDFELRHVQEVKGNELSTHIRQSQLVLVAFVSQKGIGSLKLLRKLDELAEQHSGKIKFAVIYGDQDRKFMLENQIVALPEVRLYRAGVISKRFEASVALKVLLDHLTLLCSVPSGIDPQQP